MFVPRPRELLAIDIELEQSERRHTTSKVWSPTPPSWKRVPLYPDILTPGNLRRTAAWIRDVLDPVVACNGPGVLRADDVLTIHIVLLALQAHQMSLYVLRFSRIHLAVANICGKATRWPKMLIDESDRVIDHLVQMFGPLKDIKLPLFELDGRLHGICGPSEITRDVSFLPSCSLLLTHSHLLDEYIPSVTLLSGTPTGSLFSLLKFTI
jgi:hypothetical protein